MKKSLLFSPVTLVFLCCIAPVLTNAEDQAEAKFIPNPQVLEKQEVITLSIGDPLPEFSLPDVNGNWVSSGDFADAKILTIVFLSNHCPTAQAYEDRIIDYTEEYREKGVQVLVIMPNSSKGLLLEECAYSDMNDSYEEMKIRARDKHYNFPYLYDGDNHKVSLLFGPAATPHVFVFDQDRKLQYVGRIDAHEKPGSGHAEDLRNATDALLQGRLPELQETKAFGCSVKWAWKLEWTNKVNSDWENTPVKLDSINLDGVAELVKNPTKKLLLINVWATWCAPCVMEYPEFVTTQRMYGSRDFEFISISLDNPPQKDKAHAFLEKSHSALKNYIFEGTDKYKFIEALDPNWNGALPYTILFEPGGEVVWSYQGPVDFLELRRKIVDHPMIGRYITP
jgi:thiol-disulfide isomerase/thioredoxin